MSDHEDRIKALEWEIKRKEREENAEKIKLVLETINEYLRNINDMNKGLKDILD